MTGETDRGRDGTAADGGTESFAAEGARRTTKEGAPELAMEEQREFLEETVRRASLLRSLQSGSAEPSHLSGSLDMSRSTVHRAVNSLEEYDVVEKSNGKYELTGTGEVIAQEVGTFAERMCTVASLKQFLNSIETNGHGIPVQHFVDAEVIRQKPRQPHSTIHRIIELIEGADRLRMLSTVISPVYVDVGYREMMDGMKIEAIFDREVLDLMLSEFPEKAHETIRTGNFEVYAHDGLPFELFVFDDRMGMAAHTEDSNAEVLVECDDPAAIEWAEALYAERRAEAEPLMTLDTL